jgi:hemoglobin-like flavoprotein
MGLEAKLVKDSFELAKPIADKLVKRFYENLSTDYPQSKSLYLEGQMPEQQLAVLKALVFIVDNLDNKEKLNTFLTTLSERYDFGLTDPLTNQWVRSSFLKTLSEAFGSDWTSELSEQWQLAYQWVSTSLQRSTKTTTTTSKKTVELATVISFPGASGASCELPTEVKNSIREEARKTVNALLQREYQTALNAEINSLTDESVKSVILKKAA